MLQSRGQRIHVTLVRAIARRQNEGKYRKPSYD
jgi:hypothetical protein